MKNLKELRKKYHYTQDDMAKILGISRTMVVQYEKEDFRKIPKQKETILCNTFKVKPIILYGDCNFINQPTTIDECDYLISILNQIKATIKCK